MNNVGELLAVATFHSVSQERIAPNLISLLFACELTDNICKAACLTLKMNFEE